MTPQEKRQTAQLHRMLHTGKPVCIFTGAGFSCPSGLPDFRSANGIYNKTDDCIYSPEDMVSRRFLQSRPKEFFTFYREKMVWPAARPNAAHRYAAALEADGIPVSVVTQNIDGLHTDAGNTRVMELHGSIHRNYCMRCRKRYGLQAVLDPYDPDGNGVPHCPDCGGIVRPDVVLYGEGLDDDTVGAAIDAIAGAGTLLVAGTSLAVYPAAGFLHYFQGEYLAVVNLTPTPLDRRAETAIYADIGEVFEELFRLDERS